MTFGRTTTDAEALARCAEKYPHAFAKLGQLTADDVDDTMITMACADIVKADLRWEGCECTEQNAIWLYHVFLDQCYTTRALQQRRRKAA